MKYKQTVSQYVIDELYNIFTLKELGAIDELQYFHMLKDIEQKALRMEYEQFEKLRDFEYWKEWKDINL